MFFVSLHLQKISMDSPKKWFGNCISFQVWHHFSGCFSCTVDVGMFLHQVPTASPLMSGCFSCRRSWRRFFLAVILGTGGIGDVRGGSRAWRWNLARNLGGSFVLVAIPAQWKLHWNCSWIQARSDLFVVYTSMGDLLIVSFWMGSADAFCFFFPVAMSNAVPSTNVSMSIYWALCYRNMVRISYCTSVAM